jgi:Transposase IS116/IS110/IS902 family
MAATASRSTRAQSPAATASFGATHERPTQATFASARYAGAVSAPMPPVGQKHRPASGAATALSQPRPPDVSAGKNFSSWKPCSCRGDLRSGDAADHAVRRDEDARTAKRADAAPDPADAGSPADNAEQHDPGPHGGVGDRRADRRNGLDQLLAVPSDLDDQRVPALARDCLVAVAEQLLLVKGKILDMDRRIAACHRSSDMSRRLAEIPGIGPLVATALVATVPDPRPFASARNFAAWIGLLPKQNSSGGKERLGGITRQGNRYLLSTLTVGALAVIRYAERHGTRRPWIIKLLARRPTRVGASLQEELTATKTGERTLEFCTLQTS